jgi:hypothetical protein
VELFLTLREEHRLRVFQSTVLRGIFEPKKKDEATKIGRRNCKGATKFLLVT